MKKETQIWAAFIAVCVIWGSTYLAIRIGVSKMPPFLFAGTRFLTAGTLMLLYAKIRGLEFPNKFVDIKNIAIVGLFLLLGGHGLVVWTEQWVASGIASILVATVPLFMAIIEFIKPNGTKLSIKGWTGLLVGFLGVVFLTLSKTSAVIDIKGTIFLLLASLLWAMGSVYQKTFEATGSTVTHIGIEMVAGGISLILLGLSIGEAGRFVFSTTGIGAMLYLIFFGSIIGYSSYIYVLQNWPSSKAGTYAYINPIVAVILGALILNEPLSLRMLFSTIIILLGVILVQTSKTNQQKEDIND